MYLGILFGFIVAFLLFLKWSQVFRPVERTPQQVISILRNVLITEGDMEWDDFISIRIKNPELEKIRLRCEEVNFGEKDVFQQVVTRSIAELEASQSRPFIDNPSLNS